MRSPGGERPLAGRTIVVTRAAHQSRELAEALEARGARVIELPTIAIRAVEDTRELDACARALEQGRYAMLVLGSKNAAELFFARVREDVRVPIACVGAKTKAYVASVYPHAEIIVPDVYRAEQLAELVLARAQLREEQKRAAGFSDPVPEDRAAESAEESRGRRVAAESAEESRGRRVAAESAEEFRGRRVAAVSAAGSRGPRDATVLFPRAAEGRDALIAALEARGIAVEAPVAYHIAPAERASPEMIAALAGADTFTFLSGETLRAFLHVLPEPEARALLARAQVAVIGPVAKEKADALGIRVDLVPPTATIEALVAALCV